MKYKKVLTFIFVLILAFSIVSPVMAGDGDGEPTGITEKDEDEGSGLPILKYFSEYYGLKTVLDCDDPTTEDIEVCPPPEPLDCEGVDVDDPICTFAGTIGAFHDSGIGFGVLANLMMISTESQDCEEPLEPEVGAEPVCNPITFEKLMALYAGGMSLGEIYEIYGRPASSGVGGLKNATKVEDKCGTDGSGPPGLCGDKDNGKPENPGKPENSGKNNKKP